jgi:hypothetical protein
MAAQSNQNHLLIIEDDKGRKEFPLEELYIQSAEIPSRDIRYFHSLSLVDTPL